MFGVCLRYARDRNEADDMAQDAWIKIFGKLDKVREVATFSGWLRTLTVNCCLENLRRRRIKINDDAAARLADGNEPLPESLHVSPTAIASMSADELVAHINQLPEGYRLVFNLVALEGYSHKEAADALGITASTSRSQLTRARDMLQRRLAQVLSVCL